MNKFLVVLVFLSLSIGIVACYKNPVTGRRSVNLVDEGTMRSMATQQYATFLGQNPPITNGSGNEEMVKRVGDRIAKAVHDYLASRNELNLIDGYQWEFNLVNNNEANAWCMPGGKVVVYTGMMPLVKDENGLAVVLGHEISHALARHGNERMSQQLLAQLGGTALSVAVSSKPSETQAIFNNVYNVTSQGSLLAYSRTQESEADHSGLILMAYAGYDPTSAVAFWTRMAAASSNAQKPPVFLSTHPSDAKRIQQIKDWLPEAMKVYRPK